VQGHVLPSAPGRVTASNVTQWLQRLAAVGSAQQRTNAMLTNLQRQQRSSSSSSNVTTGL
jgi:hypothetical protein